MRSIELKLSAGALKASWLLAPGCAKSADRIPVLVITDVPDEVTDVAATALANKTMINTPAHSKEPARVEYKRLGEGKIVNLVMGRPPVPEAQRKDVEVVTMRMEGAERRAKFRKLGREWLERQVDLAE